MKNEHSAGVILFYVDQKDNINKTENTGTNKNIYTRNYLLLQYIHGYWDFPKGKLEHNETEKEAAIRELKEEANQQTKLIPGFEEHLYYTYRDSKGDLINKTVAFFVGQTENQDVKISHEHINYIWLPYKEASEKLTYLSAKNILRDAEHFLDNLNL